MNLKKYLMNETYIEEDLNEKEILEEGIRFFKVSKRLTKLVNKLTQKIDLIDNAHSRKALIIATNKIQRLSNKFKKLEDAYSNEELMSANKPLLKTEYKKLMQDYKEILTLMKSEELKAVLKTINQYGFLLLTMAIPLKFMAPVSNAIGIDLNDTSWTGLFKRSGIYLALGMPARIASSAISKGIDKLIDKDRERGTLEGEIYNLTKNRDI
jgi:hypothetical protein